MTEEKKSKGGRKKKPESHLKKRHNLSFTDTEWQNLEKQKTDAQADSVSAYIVTKLNLKN